MAILPAEGTHRLLVTAHFSDGHTEDYTHQALYTVERSAKSPRSARTAWSAPNACGETSILVRAAGQVASVGVGVIGPPMPDYPKVARSNFIDDFVFDKLRKFQIVPSDLGERFRISAPRLSRPHRHASAAASACANSWPAPIRDKRER